MTNKQFKQRLLQLQEVIMRALAFYAVWNKLQLHDHKEVSWSLDQQNRILGQWNGFFMPVSIALQDMAMLQFAKVFDTNPRTASLYVLLREAERDRRLVPHAAPEFLSDAKAKLQQAEATYQAIKKLRDQRIAHTDANPKVLPPLMNRNVESLCEDIKHVFNQLASAHDRNFYSWDFALRTSVSETTDILRLLLAEIDRKDTHHDQQMVEIGVGHVRDMETRIGRPLAGDELESALGQLGLTPGQADRIRIQLGQ
ncbi:MAG TPA: hypothetical protein VFS30_11135 [Dehalococcoidia bacterium]|nr:hypothetical protein [Dehalococcoidia bacterium]